uniref:Uncharacterized protein n=1 Tax=Arundo donax TaxID=35708 RepID=A0A0A9FHG8_ARUDO
MCPVATRNSTRYSITTSFCRLIMILTMLCNISRNDEEELSQDDFALGYHLGLTCELLRN